MHAELVGESTRLGRLLHAAIPEDTDTMALLALMLLTDARTAARTDADGRLIALPDQDRTLWDPAKLVEGHRFAANALATGPAAPLVIQAAIAAVLEQSGALDAARDAYADARERTRNEAERGWLLRRTEQLDAAIGAAPASEPDTAPTTGNEGAQQ